MRPSQERRKRILQNLIQEGRLDLDTLAKELDISIMTINRDVQLLASEGLVKRVHGGIVLPETEKQETTCATCHAPITTRTQFFFTTATGANLSYCCPHCGLAQLKRLSASLGVFSTDFLYGTMINAYHATYVINSRISLCCEPSVLCFKEREDALAFKNGFGGGVMNIEETANYLFSH
jgi:DeoR family transcriptional regulator, copper-sensing transcriptional repressor